MIAIGCKRAHHTGAHAIGDSLAGRRLAGDGVDPATEGTPGLLPFSVGAEPGHAPRLRSAKIGETREHGFQRLRFTCLEFGLRPDKNHRFVCVNADKSVEYEGGLLRLDSR